MTPHHGAGHHAQDSAGPCHRGGNRFLPHAHTPNLRPHHAKWPAALEHPATPKIVDVVVHYLRKKIGHALVATVAGVGYSFPEEVERKPLRR